MAARAKAGFEERNEKIINLKMKLNLVTNTKRNEYIGLLSDGSDIPAYGQLHDQLALVMRQRDDAIVKAKKYKGLLGQVQLESSHINGMISNGE